MRRWARERKREMQKEREHQHEGHTTREPQCHSTHIATPTATAISERQSESSYKWVDACVFHSRRVEVCVYVFVYVHILWFDVLTLWKTIQLVRHSGQCLQNAIACVRRNAIYTLTRCTHTSSPTCLFVSVSGSIAFPCAFRYYCHFYNELWFVVKCGCVHVCICSSATMQQQQQQHGWMEVSVPRVHQIHVLIIVSLSFC